MKRFLQNLKLDKKELLTVLAIMLLGLFVRLWQIELRTGFDFDQAEIAFKAKELLGGDPVLLGQKTSVGGFSIGPLYIYLWAIFSFLMGKDPAAGAYLTSFIGFLTIPVFYIAAREFFNKRVAIFAAIFVAFSYNIIVWDQSPWGPSLFYVSEVLMLLGAYLATKKPYGLIIAALGFSVGFHSHVAIFLSLLAILIFWIFYRPILRKKEIVISAAFVLMSLLPNLIYDLAKNFVNVRRIFSVFSSSQEGAAVTLERLFDVVHTSAISTFYPHPEKSVSLLIFVAILLLVIKDILKGKKEKPVLLLMLFSIFIPMFVFIFHKSTFSEYYLMMVIPAFIFIVSYFANILTKCKFILYTLLGLFLFVNLNTWYVQKRPLNLKAKKNIATKIIEVGGRDGYGVSFTTQLGLAFGFDYIFDYYQMSPDVPPKKGEVKIFTVVIPADYLNITTKIEFDGIGLTWEGFD